MHGDEITLGPVFRWFAYRPVNTRDRGWRWMRVVWRRRRCVTTGIAGRSRTTFDNSVAPF